MGGNCILLPAVGKQNTTFSPNITQPGKVLLVQPCSCSPWDHSGTDTVSAFVEWFTLYMAAFPDVQEKVHAEVSRVAGNRRPVQAQRAEMHFTEATILEVMSSTGPEIITSHGLREIG